MVLGDFSCRAIDLLSRNESKEDDATFRSVELQTNEVDLYDEETQTLGSHITCATQTGDIKASSKARTSSSSTSTSTASGGEEKEDGGEGEGKERGEEAKHNERQQQEEDVLGGFDRWDHPPKGLARFLETAGTTMLRELEANSESRAFEDYDPIQRQGRGGGGGTGGEAGVELRYSLDCDLSDLLQASAVGNTDRASDGLQCTGLAWNATGSSVMASFGRFDITGWCDVPGALATWNIFRRGFDPSTPGKAKPDVLLDHSSCLMCVACHPVRPALVCAGSFNGEVLVWDLAREEPLIASSKIDDFFHREPVGQVVWVYSTKEEDYRIASVSGDGKILLWSLTNLLACPMEGYRLTPGRGSRGGANDRGGGKGRAGAVIGGTSISVPSEGRHVSSIIAGSEGGAVLRCFLANNCRRGGGSSSTAIKGWSADASELLSKVDGKHQASVKREVERKARDQRVKKVDLALVYAAKPDPCLLFPAARDFGFEKHVGPVHSVECSPFHRAIFLTSGADGTARVHTTLQSKALITLDPSSHLMAAHWSKTRPLVFAAAAGDGTVHMYDLAESTSLPVVSLELPAFETSTSQGRSGGGKGGRAGGGGAQRREGLRGAGGDEVATCALAFNPRQRDFLASGDGAGRVHIWQLSWGLANAQAGEAAALEQLFQSSMEQDGGGEARGGEGGGDRDTAAVSPTAAAAPPPAGGGAERAVQGRSRD